jgi:alpha-beta hydrolase superfamily lysophospholipase
MRRTNERLQTERGADIHLHRWRPAGGASRRLLVVHGLGEHGGRYGQLAKAAVARGWDVMAPDLRGHGGSSGRRGHVRRFDDYLDDLVDVLRRTADDNLPLAVLGHSMGGLIAARLVAAGRVEPAALALSSPLFGIAAPVGWFWRALGRALNPTLPWASFNSGLNDDDATRDPVVLAARRNDPLTHRRVTARWFCEIAGVLKGVHGEASQIGLPLLVLQAGEDRMVCTEASRRFFDLASSRDKQFRLFDEHYHELFGEITREAIIDELLDWLEPRVTAKKLSAFSDRLSASKFG